MKLTGLRPLKIAFYCRAWHDRQPEFFSAFLDAAETAKETPITSGWISSLRKSRAMVCRLGERLLRQAGAKCHHPAWYRVGGYNPHHRCGRG